METHIHGKQAIVCGASSGLGYARAPALDAEGAIVTIVARDRPNETAAKSLLKETGGQIRWVAGDVVAADVRQQVLQLCPEPDILINNAGGPPPGTFLDWSRDDWIRALDTNMLSAIEFMKAVLPAMAQRRFGRIVNITSGAIKAPIPMLGLSTGARLGLTGFVASIAREYLRSNVTISNLLPGPFETTRFRTTLEAAAKNASTSYEDMRASRLRSHPAGRFGRPEEFAAACVYLCSGLAGYVTAQNLLVDGASAQV